MTDLRSVCWREILPRVMVDFGTVHAAMLLALLVSVTYRTALGNGLAAAQLIRGFERYYISFFWPLSPLFPSPSLSMVSTPTPVAMKGAAERG